MNNFKKILDLINKTGDKLVITDENGDQTFVVMPLNEYQRIIEGSNQLTNLNEQELWDKVDRDIMLWKQSHQDEFEDDIFGEPTSFGAAHPSASSSGPRGDFQSEPWEKPLEDLYRDPFGSDDVKLPWEEESEPADLVGSDNEEIKDIDFPFDFEDQDESDELSEQSDEAPLKYEDIPPPPNLNVEDLMRDELDDDSLSEPKKVIDMSFSESDESILEPEDDEDESEFKEEAVF